MPKNKGVASVALITVLFVGQVAAAVQSADESAPSKPRSLPTDLSKAIADSTLQRNPDPTQFGGWGYIGDISEGTNVSDAAYYFGRKRDINDSGGGPILVTAEEIEAPTSWIRASVCTNMSPDRRTIDFKVSSHPWAGLDASFRNKAQSEDSATIPP